MTLREVCAVCGAPLVDDSSWYADFGSPDHGGDEVVACSREHLAQAVAAWVEPPEDEQDDEDRSVGDVVASVVAVLVVLLLLGLWALGVVQLVQVFGGWQ